MDLHDFTPTSLYFDEKLPLPVQSLLSLASRRYGQGVSERALLEASRMAPRSLTVLVGLYRHYYYQ
ncbi:MAG: hypothetical protein SV583_03690, partial [Pseudomonadota bacterium]|nr:hypothetical protein [Pseudomonadota bacterium]